MSMTGHSTASNREPQDRKENLTAMSPVLGRLAEFLDQGRRSAEELHDYFKRNKVSADDLAPWARFDHPENESYGRSEIWHNQFWGMYAMSWLPGDGTAIHGHGSTEEGVVLFLGKAEHRVYSLAGERLELSEYAEFPPGTILPVCEAEYYHAMGNRGVRPFMTLHLYGARDSHGHSTAGARVIELERDRVVTSPGPAFINMPDELCLSISQGVLADQRSREDYLEYVRPFYSRIGVEIGSGDV